MTPQQKLVGDIDHAVHQRNVLEDYNFFKEITSAVDRYLVASYGIRLQPQSGSSFVERLAREGLSEQQAESLKTGMMVNEVYGKHQRAK